LSPTGAAFAWGAGIAGALFLLTGLLVVADRALFDRRRAVVGRLTAIVVGPIGAKLDPRTRRAWASGLLRALPRRRLERIASESTLPRELDELVCRSLLDRTGLVTLRRQAAATGGWRSRWSRIAALRVLAFGKPDFAWPAIGRALLARDREVVAAAVAMLGRMPDRRAATLLVKALRVGRYQPSRIATSLDRSPFDLSGLIRPMLVHPGGRIRYWGAMLVRRYPRVAGGAEALVRLTRDEEPLVRRAAVEALSAAGGDGARAAALALLADDVWFVRAHAARALGALQSVEDAPRVARLLADREWSVRDAARAGLEAMGPDVARSLIPLLDGPDRFARNGAAEVLQNVGTFERLLTEEATGPGDPVRTDRLGRLARAGGYWMSEAVLDRLPADAHGRAVALLASLGVERAGAGGRPGGPSGRPTAAAAAQPED